MKFFPLAMTTAVAGILLSIGTSANATIPIYEYVFTATPGNPTSFDGSTISVSAAGTLVSWDLFDTSVNTIQYTSANSTDFSDITAASPSSWTGSFTVSSDTLAGILAVPGAKGGSGVSPAAIPSYITFTGTDTGDANSDGTLSDLVIGTIDPPGTWAPYAPGGTVPDGFNTSLGLMAVLVGFGAAQPFLRKQAALSLRR